MAVCLLFSMYFLARTAAQYTMSQRGDQGRPVVVIDAGHGGVDPGKVGINGALEKDINLSVALLVEQYLEAQDVKVVMTRNSDEGLYREDSVNKKMEDLKHRLALIDTAGAVIAVSIHQNSYTMESVHGAQVFYYDASEEGKKAAEIMQNQLRTGIDGNNKREVKANSNYYLLKKSAVPTIIVECGFLSNGEEAEKLIQKEYQEKMAWNISLGILQYLNGVL
nr:N-acetylmuramoyl-L-alanine amidase [Lachnospiraceae bacterium]